MSLFPNSSLDPRTAALARQWGVSVTETQQSATSQLAFGRRGTTPVVLKVLRRPGDEWGASGILRAFHGRGMVRLLESVPGAVLLERLCPGTPVAGLTIAGKDDEATRVLAEVLHQFAPERSPPGTPSVEDWGKGFPAYLASGDSRLPRGLVERSAAWYRHLAGSQRKIRLLHGDFHHHNVLTDQKRGWVAIDPKGVLGEMEFEVGAALRNPLERLAEFSNPRAVERRVSHFARHLRLDLERTLAWAYAQAVLSAIWLIEDRVPLEQGEPTIALARRMEAMLPPPP